MKLYLTIGTVLNLQDVDHLAPAVETIPGFCEGQNRFLLNRRGSRYLKISDGAVQICMEVDHNERRTYSGGLWRHHLVFRVRTLSLHPPIPI